jgi:hypothetical protein
VTGSEHYREAERLLEVATASTETTFEGHNPEADRTIAEAHVHALLAKAPTDESTELAALRGFVREVRTIARFGDMSTTARQELMSALSELNEGGAR